MRLLLIVILLVVSFIKGFAQTSHIDLLHATRGIHAGIYDEQGRRILLRGVNYSALEDNWQALPDLPAQAEYNDKDIAMMAEHGFNCIRLTFNWSLLEPERGRYNMDYVKKITHCIEEAAKYNIYILVDMHQDAWGKYINTTDTAEHCSRPAKGWDGAPQWATITDGKPTCTRKGRESAPAVFRAWHHFWDDDDSLQEACINAWKVMVAATAKYNNVVGYDLLNEPNMGERSMTREDILQGKYYNKLIKGIRETETKNALPQHIIFFEVNVTLRGKEWPSVPYTTFRPEKNIIFSPHHYFESLSNDLTIKGGFGAFRLLSFFYHMDMLVGEWGYFRGAADTNKVKRYCAQEDKYFVGSTWWQWSQACGNPHTVWWQHDHWVAPDRCMHLIELDRQAHFTGRINEPIMDILDRSHPIAVCGNVVKLRSNPDTGNLLLKGRTHKPGTVTLWIQGRFGKPVIAGNNIDNIKIDSVVGGYKAEVRVKKKYEIRVKQ